MRTMPKMVEVMTPFPHTVSPDEPVQAALQMMERHRIHQLPVVSGRHPIGLLTERDIRIALGNTPSPDVASLHVEDVCVPEPYVVSFDDRLDQVAIFMANERVTSAIVVRDDRVVGIFTAVDACRKLGELLREHYPDA